MSLAEERIRFLSTRRCRHFLAAIAPQLLAAIAETADPDSTLVNLDTVSDSLGGKGVLWELFSFNPPSLRLYVELCAYSPYLSGILTSNPGMIDGLMDSLVLDKLPTPREHGSRRWPNCAAPPKTSPRSCRASRTTSSFAWACATSWARRTSRPPPARCRTSPKVCLAQIAAREPGGWSARFGRPHCEMAILALGKFGGREMNYHSDLDIIFLYEADGHTVAESGSTGGQTTTNQHFFSELGQRIIQAASRPSGYGRLYEVDVRLRPTGRSGTLATSFDEFARYFAGGGGQLWERLALCKARVVYGSPRVAEAAMALVARGRLRPSLATRRRGRNPPMRQRLEDTAAAAGDLKRGPGGIVDIEFLVQMLQLKHAGDNPQLRVANTLAALGELHKAGLLSADDFEFFDRSYRLLRTIEGRLRLMNSTARDQLPRDPVELTKLAHLLHYPSSDALLADYESATREIRRRFERVFEAEATPDRL